jgi:hypothetical protein
MSNVISRRDFFKASSAIGLAAAVNPASAITTSTKKSRVVIATDTTSVSSSGTPDATKIQALVDHAIMTFTGISDKAAAYEAVFPEKPTSSTKIFMKRNDASGKGAVNKAVTDAFAAGLKSMLGGAFPAANIDNPSSLPMNPNLKSKVDSTTYIINCPVTWCHVMPQYSYGVTLSLKNTMCLGCPSGGNPPSGNHSQYKALDSTKAVSQSNYTYPWLWEVSLSSAVKPKQVLSLLDAVVGSAKDGPGTGVTFKAGTVIVGSDLVAVDYNAIRLMEKQTGAKTDQLAYGDRDLKQAEKAGLGTCTEANMEIIKINAPWPSVGTINGSDAIMQSMNIRVLHQGNKVDFVIPGASSKHVSVFDMKGNALWQSQHISGESVSWDLRTTYGARVPSGMYVYRIACNRSIMRGTVMVTH